MNEYIIKQRINTSSIPPTVYEEDEKGKNSCICIASKDGKYGMVTEDGKPFLPFEYDNISMAGFHLYLLIQNGKIGLLHARRPSLCDDKPFEIIKLIPCEYDMITFPGGR